ncbi:MAG: FAD-dependent oxidoreductase, partial [Anaerolineales bacterium]|nr:FAD-dependent oxidoreductase [Anaerolineales bacterium]
MAKIVIIGAGFAGHTAALYLGSALGKKHSITMINQSDRFLYVPSLVWVGIGRMEPDKTRFALKPVYDRMHVKLEIARATEIHPDEQYVVAEKKEGGTIRVDYDYLIMATGPQLDFDATPGLGPAHENSYSICTAAHAQQARDMYLETVARMKAGDKQKIVIGVGHGTATCEGAAFEYVSNVHKDLVRRGVREKAELVYLTNERAVGDFGVGGIHVKYQGKPLSSAEFMSAAFKEYGITPEIQKGVVGVEKGVAHWQDFQGKSGDTTYDFAMLIPRFRGMPFRFIGREGQDVASKLVNPMGFILVDGIYGLPYEKLSVRPDAWPAVYQNQNYRNIFAGGIAFAPPGPISI